jgi:recombination protein RecT
MSNQLTVIRNDISAMKPEFAKALPAHVTPEKFERTTMTAIANNPDILACDKTSILSSCMKAAQDGLILDGKEATLVARNTKNKDGTYSKLAVYTPMVAGLMKLVRNSGEVIFRMPQVVYSNDKFSYNPANNEAPQHAPDWFGTRGEPIGVYAVAQLKDGTIVVEIMSKDQVLAIGNQTPNKHQYQTTSASYAEWWRKTAIRRISKYLPKSTDRDMERAFQAIERGDEDFDFADPAPVQPSKRTKRAAEILNAETIEVNPETGEVMDGAGSVTEPVGEPAESDVM